MDTNKLNNLAQFLMNHGYLILFIFSIIEGSIVSMAAGILAKLGYFNIFIVLSISVLGDIIPDIIYYFIGKYGSTFIKGKSFFKNKKNILTKKFNLKDLTEKHPIKSLIFVKFSPFIGPFGLVAIGSFKPDIKKYIKNISIISIIKSVFFVFLGYLSGGTYLYFTSSLKSIEKSIAIPLLIILIGFITYKILINKELKNIEKNN